MRKPGTSPEQHLIALLARHLLAPSQRFENPAQAAQAQARDGLRCLAALDGTTRLSLPAPAPEPTPAGAQAPQPEAPAAAAATPPAAAEPAPPHYGSRRPEYQPGLGDHGVVRALLDFHTRLKPPGAAQAPLAAFRAARAAAVEARPKPGGLHKAGTTRIFRPRGD